MKLRELTVALTADDTVKKLIDNMGWCDLIYEEHHTHGDFSVVITSYSIHYTKLYDSFSDCGRRFITVGPYKLQFGSKFNTSQFSGYYRCHKLMFISKDYFCSM